jgi:hypothetical protein
MRAHVHNVIESDFHHRNASGRLCVQSRCVVAPIFSRGLVRGRSALMERARERTLTPQQCIILTNR